MSSISMGLAGHQISIDGHPSNPGTLNEYLKQNGGYTEQNDLLESVVPSIDPSRISWNPAVDMILSGTDLTTNNITQILKEPDMIIIGNVMQGRHFVLLTGYSLQNPDQFFVNDPGFNTTFYMYSDFVGYRMFNMYNHNHHWKKNNPPSTSDSWGSGKREKHPTK